MGVNKMTDENFKQYVIELGRKGLRHDGRSLLEYRKPIHVELGISKNAEGSAMVTMGKTKVACGIKLEISEPYPDKPDEGSLMVTAEFAALASPTFEPGAPGEESIELARIVDRGIREAGAIDTKKLCIKSGEKVWMVIIDLYIQNHDGNLIDAAALAAIAALFHTKYPKFDGEKIDYNEHTKEPLLMVRKPIAVTFAKIGDVLMLDTTVKEESVIDSRLTVTTDEHGVINAMQKGGSDTMKEEELFKIVDMAIEKAKELRSCL
jgi:exosome complex component RRP42